MINIIKKYLKNGLVISFVSWFSCFEVYGIDERSDFLNQEVTNDLHLLEQITHDEGDSIASLLREAGEDTALNKDFTSEEVETETRKYEERVKKFQKSVEHINEKWDTAFPVPLSAHPESEEFGREFFGDTIYEFLGLTEESKPIGPYGEREICDKVRVSYINGILNTRDMMIESLRFISESHGGVLVHSVFRPTLGWTQDVLQGLKIKLTYIFGYYSQYAECLANLWRSLIKEMGGVDGGGVIVHYAHSLGGTDTDRARDLLSEEEQRLIRVITFGSATMVRKVNFQHVINIKSSCDGIPGLDMSGYWENFHDEEFNVCVRTAEDAPVWPFDHLLTGATYGPILESMGHEFQKEFINL